MTTTSTLTRRTALALGGAGALAVAGCTRAPGEPGPALKPEGDESVLPDTIANETLPYDLLPSADGVVPGILLSYPDDPPATVDTVPGAGGELTAACPIYVPTPTAMDRNQVWQAINDAVGTSLNISYAPGAEWAAKQQSLLAGGQLPDVFMLTADTPRLPEVLTSSCADLSEHLSGDRIADYPNLALNSSTAWANLAYDKGIFGIPRTVPRYGGVPLRTRIDILEELGLADVQPTNGEEMMELMREVSASGANRWASAIPSVDMFAQMLGAPNGWRDDGGTLSHVFASPQYLTAIEKVVQLWQDNVYHPDSFATGTFPGSFDAGTTVIEYGGFDPGTRIKVGIGGDPDYRVGFLTLPTFDGGGMAEAWTVLGLGSISVLRPDSPDKIAERLRVLNWIAAPTGTKEGTLSRYGIEGRNFDMVDGAVTANPDHKDELMVLGYLAAAPVTFTATSPVIADMYRDFHASLTEQYANPKEDPTFGLYSATDSAEGATWAARFDDVRAQVIQDRAPISTWTDTVAEWQSAVGDTIAGEYEEALSA